MAERESGMLCHELLLRLAGRLPDDRIWRFRDWLAGGAGEVVALSLPTTLVRQRIGLTDADHRLLSEALLPLGADPAVVDAVLPAEEPDRGGFTFSAEGPALGGGDSEALVLGATLRGRHGVHEVRSTWRHAAGSQRPQRVLIVTASADPVELTGEIQRILRALGKHEPRVEVLPPGAEPTAYHRAALSESTSICTGAGELVRHG